MCFLNIINKYIKKCCIVILIFFSFWSCVLKENNRNSRRINSDDSKLIEKNVKRKNSIQEENNLLIHNKITKKVFDKQIIPLVSDIEFGQLIDKLSENTGEFPSDNFVSNETSYLNVTQFLINPQFEGKGYIGVGPEQNLTYIALMKPRIAYILDIRRENMVQYVFYQALFETSKNRVEFISRLTSRKVPQKFMADTSLITIDEIIKGFIKVFPSKIIFDKNIQDTINLSKRAGIKLVEKDLETINLINEAFYKSGLKISYSMEGSKRRYPSLGEILALKDNSGNQSSFMGNEKSYKFVRDMFKSNRIIPVTGDFAGQHALKAIALDMKNRGIKLGVFYTSNVEQYLFQGKVIDQFVNNVEQLPVDENSIFIRVWFDQGKAHPLQQAGERTTTVAMPIKYFLNRWHENPYKNYWRVVIDNPFF